jgi:two-component system sensor histidine kinase/response regulator
VALAERLAHSLKGVAGNIGAKDVQSAAGVLEKAIRDHATAGDVETAQKHAGAALDLLVTGLRQELRGAASEAATQPTAATPPHPLIESREAAVRLNALLAESDPGAADFVEANQAALRTLFDHAGWPEFEKLVQDYAFAEAQSQLEQALKSFQV